jgi:muconolactone delta-isomerase
MEAGMDHLVTMTTTVPDGTPDGTVDDVRAREAARAAELAAQGHLLRLWRPPLRPGEWRTLGLFSAADEDELERLLASMPLRVWRHDDVTPLAPHPNDPGLRPPVQDDGTVEFLTTFTLAVPDGTPTGLVEDTLAAEAHAARRLADEGHLLRLWQLPGAGRALGLWRTGDRPQLDQILAELPLAVPGWMEVDTVALTRHPNDPG